MAWVDGRLVRVPYAVATSNRISRRARIALAAVVLVGATIGGLAALPSETNAENTLSLGELQVSSVNETVDGNVTDVRLDATIDYQYDVADGERRIVKLQVGETRDDMENLTFAQSEITDARSSGQVSLEASILEAQGIDANDFDPALAESKSKTIYVGVVIEVRRANGETVTESVVREATVTLHDGGTISVAVGGDVSVVVDTDN